MRKLKNIYLLSFLIPVLGILGIFVDRGVFPFGSNSFMYSDMYHQYIPFLTEFWRKLHSGESLAFSWRAGLGSNFFAIYAYYLASPENWLVYFCPEGYLIEFMTFFIVIKIGLCGVTFAHYLRKHFQTKNLCIVWFSVFYAFSGYVAAYNWNHMWLNCLWLTPLILLGLEGLIKERKCCLYCLTLTASILTNYYISILLCIFLVLYFLLHLFTNGLSLKEKGLAVLHFTLTSLLAGGMSAILLFPVVHAMLATDFGSFSLPKKVEVYFNALEMLARHVPMLQTERGLDHWPNIYCGVLVFVLVPIYFWHKAIPLKEKLGRLLLLGIFLASFAVNILNFIWHGMNYPDSLPARQSFLYIFLILTMCFEAVHKNAQNGWLNRILGVACGVLLLAGCSIFVNAKGLTAGVMASAWVFLVGYLLIWLTFNGRIWKALRKARPMRKLALYGKWAILILVVVEAVMNMEYTSLRAVKRNYYLGNIADYKVLIGEIEEQDEDFYRVDSLKQMTKNDGMLSDYASVSIFSSTVHGGVEDYYDRLGMGGNKVSYYYRGATPLTAAMLGVRYTISWQEERDSQVYRMIAGQGDKYLYENMFSLPVGFLLSKEEKAKLEKEILENTGNDIVFQNGLTLELCGKHLFTVLGNRECINKENGISVKALVDGHLFGVVSGSPEGDVILEFNGETRKLENVDNKCLLDLGWYAQGESFSVTAEEGESLAIRVYRLSLETLEAAINKLGEVPFTVGEVTSIGLMGTIEAPEEGFLLLSVPYDSGWMIWVDGELTEAESFSEALLAVPLSTGIHRVEIRYVLLGLKEGALVSTASCILFWLLYVRRRRKPVSN
ncbi:MAG: YfhO family protein [Lachnospiraceae bacterium]|nr:YfhO family protein [Lachnospiraceae bacterium]